jgi:uncharacterized secreted protein with C-terminal beta-propeller domain
MRGIVVLAALLLAVPLAGCLGGASITMFADWRLPGGSAAPVAAKDCGDLLSILNQRAGKEADTLLEQALKGRTHHVWGLGGRDVAFAADAMEDGAATQGAEVTGTNNQEAGVDEADILKTDGEWTYTLQGGYLYILRSLKIGEAQDFARIQVEAEYSSGSLLLVRGDISDPDDDRLVLITQEHGGYHYYDSFYGMPERTRIRVLDIADRSDPKVVKEMWVEGHNVGARLVDGHAYIVLHTWRNDLPLRTSVYPDTQDLEARGITWNEYSQLSELEQRTFATQLAKSHRQHNKETLAEARLQDHLPMIEERTGGGSIVNRPMTEDACRQVLVTPEATGRSVSTIVALAVEETDIPDRVTQTLGSQPIVYGAKNALVLAAASRDPWWFWDQPRVDEATDLQWFDLDGLAVTPRASGRVPGTILDSFAIDVADDTLRVATTTGQWARWWLDFEDREPMMNHLIILEAQGDALVPRGMVGGIAPGERIWSARFTDTRAYIITFQQIDPLWIIDLSDKTKPRILGELEIPGVSTYIHPINDDLLLAIGIGPGPQGQGLDWSRVQVSLFDISDESAPRRAAVMDLSPPGGWSWSGATNEHKAFTYWDRLGMLAVPLSTSQYTNDVHSHHVALRLIRVDPEAMTLRQHGEIDHDDLVDENPGWWGGAIERSYFLGKVDDGIVSVYAMSHLGITAHDLTTLEEQDHAHFSLRGWRHHRALL